MANLPQEKQISVNAHLDYSSDVRKIAQEFFQMAGFKNDYNRLVLIVDELFMNAVKYGSGENKEVYLTFHKLTNGVEFSISDTGTGPKHVSALELKAIVEENQKNTDIARTSGRGLSMFTSNWSDSFEISDSKYGGITVSFIKYIIQ